MNVHDSERIAGLLLDAGYAESATQNDSDIVVFNTCAVRENADNKLYGHLSHLVPLKKKNPNMIIAVGGCLAQKDQAIIQRKAPWVDVVFGTHNIDALPGLVEQSIQHAQAVMEIEETLNVFPSYLPARRESHHSAWVSISVGCNNSCTFCIVPSLRGKEVDRSPQEIYDEVRLLAEKGVVEITLLGQNVNAYGVNFADPALPRNRYAFSELLRGCGEIPGIERIRFTSPHPAEFTDDVIAAMAETPTVCPTLHMPLQSGSDKVLKAMRRSYRSTRFLDIVDDVRTKIPHASITTDIIVGFPGESEEDFQHTMDVVQKVRFSAAYTFQYSPRPGTPAANYPQQVPPEVVADRYQRLVDCQDTISYQENLALCGSNVEILVNAVDTKKAEHRLSGRARDGRLVHFKARDAQTGAEMNIRPGDIITTTVTAAAPHYLLADSGIAQHTQTLAGDLHSQAAATVTPGVLPKAQIALGLPKVYQSL